MRRFSIFIIMLFCGISLMMGCAAYSVAPVTGFIYTDVQGPLSATNHDSNSKVGMATCTSILGLVATGDASIEAAMQNGGITQIHHVDFKSKSILGIYAEFTTIVYGK